jgi:Fuc2NAc and GlcNAc transferase
MSHRLAVFNLRQARLDLTNERVVVIERSFKGLMGQRFNRYASAARFGREPAFELARKMQFPAAGVPSSPRPSTAAALHLPHPKLFPAVYHSCVSVAAVAALIVAFVVSLAVVRVVERRARGLGLIDLPNARSSHVEPRPRGGGLGIVAGVVAAVAVMAACGDAPSASIAIVLTGALLVAASGLWDDVRGLGVGPRLVVQIAAAVWVVAMRGGVDRLPLPAPADLFIGVIGVALAVVWIVAVTNFFNFMDGADGLAAGQAVVTFAALAAALWPDRAALVALATAAAAMAFLVRNWPPARIFMGDVGSAFLGFLLAALPFAARSDARPELLFVAGISLSLFLFDPVVTLIARMRRGEPIGVAHREHLYQRLIVPGHPHGRVVFALVAAAAGLSVLAAWAFHAPALRWPAAAAAGVVFAIEWGVARRRE